MKRLFDIFVALSVILLTWPLWLVAAVAIKLGSKGPVFYMAPRMGHKGKIYTMFKLRTMHVRDENEDDARITAGGTDPRIFKVGKWIRRVKVDELPQFLNVLLGQMSVVGPRPEDPKIVDKFYTDWMKETLAIKPGVTSPGALWLYTNENRLMNNTDDPETTYRNDVLPFKLGLEYVYLQKRSFWYDVSLVFRTVMVVLKIIGGQKQFDPPKEKDLIPDHIR